MKLDDFIGPDNTIAELKAADKWEAINELLDNLIATRKIAAANREAIAAAVRERENSMSTGIGSGVAIPHALTDHVTDVLAALGRSSRGIPFDAHDEKPANIVVLLLFPQGRHHDYLQVLANVAKFLYKK